MPDVTITLRTIDESSKATKKVKEEFNSLSPALEKAGKGIAGFVSANATLIGGLVAVGAGAAKAYMEFQNYAGSVRDLAAISGTGAVEASKLLQVLDDYQLTAQDVTAATRFMTKAGLTPTIETLAKLSDQYLAINDPMQQNEFILKNLGKGGLQWVNVLKQGGDALRAQSAEVNKSLILTDEQIKKSEQARLAIDAWSDAWQGLKVSVGSAIGALIAANAQLDNQTKQYEELTGVKVQFSRAQTDEIKNFEAFQGQLARGAAMTEFYKNAHQGLNDVLGQTPEELQALADSGNQFMSVLGNVSDETQSYNEKNQELLDKLKSLTEEQANTATWSSKYKELSGEIESTKGAIADLAAEHKKASQKIIFDLISQQAAANGFKDISVEALAQLGEQMGVLAEGSAKETALMIKQAYAWADALAGPKQTLTEINDKVRNLQKLAETGIVITADIVFTQTGGAYGGSDGGGACFTGATLVILGDLSTKPIKDVQVGDTVLSYDTEHRIPTLATVIETFEHPIEEVKRLLLINDLRVTPEHLLWNGFTWQSAGEFEPGDLLMDCNGGMVKINFIIELDPNEPVYNLHTDNDVHNYFAGGVLVHNAKTNNMWTGGQLNGNGWTLVGDMPGGVPGPFSELISPSGHVYNAKESKALLSSGILNGVQSMSEAGDVYNSGGGGSTTGGSTGGGGIKTKPKGGKIGGSGISVISGSPTTQTVANQPTTNQNDNSMVVAVIQQQIQQQQATVANGTQLLAAIQELGGIMKRDNPKAVANAVVTNWQGS